ncbi:MAG: beta-eliminating lyase-related protein, partial [Rhodobacteraceae bacterium]|nr:beta-eliminating lyase-related protein [Paracoccaceae bacterium]
CDGARLFNAAVAQGVAVDTLVAPCHSVSFCLSKGLGAPVGSLLASDAATIHEARRIRKQLGGGMRPAGIVAAAGLYALEHHIADLADDHRRAAEFRRCLEVAGLRFLRPSPTNILMLASEKPDADVAALKQSDVLVLKVGPDAIRAVFHRDITDDDTERAIEAFERIMVP